MARLTLNNSFGSCSLFSRNTSKLSSGLRRAFFGFFCPGRCLGRLFMCRWRLNCRLCGCLGGMDGGRAFDLVDSHGGLGGQPADLKEGFKMPVVTMLQNIRAEMGWGAWIFCRIWSVVVPHSLPPQCFHWLTYLLNRGWGNLKWSCTSISFSIQLKHHSSFHYVTFFSIVSYIYFLQKQIRISNMMAFTISVAPVMVSASHTYSIQINS